jgi:uncharacterized cupin superfamily protein
MAVPEAKLVEHEAGGLVPEGDGWFIMNVADCVSYKHSKGGQYIRFENEKTAAFPHYGIGIHVVWPDQPSAKYHAESNQESFMVLEGECRLIVEGEERIMKKWDFFHCAPNTAHITIGAGDGPCALLMVGARLPEEDLEYPHHPLAEKYGAQTPQEHTRRDGAYADWDDEEYVPGPFPWPL